MMIKAVQWNIGGGKIRADGSDALGPYNQEGLAYIIDVLRGIRPDVVMLQETHASVTRVQVEQLAKALELPFWVNDVYDESYIEAGQQLGQAILSRFPFGQHMFEFFFHPGWRLVLEDGHENEARRKGMTTAVATLPDGSVMELKTCHSVPYRKYGIDPLSEEARLLRESVEALAIPQHTVFLLQGDFNYNAPEMKEYLPTLIADDVHEVRIEVPTTPKGCTYDHIVYKGLTHTSTEVLSDVLTDHFPLVTEFQI